MCKAYPMGESWIVDGKGVCVRMYAQGDMSLYSVVLHTMLIDKLWQ